MADAGASGNGAQASPVVRAPGDGIQKPYFFLSYGRTEVPDAAVRHLGDEDVMVVKFFDDLCRHIRQLTDLRRDVEPGFMDRIMPAGTLWPEGVQRALATAQTFVALYRPSYFTSDFCGWEWAAFQARQKAAEDRGLLGHNAIIPVLWVGQRFILGRMPKAAAELQHTEPTITGKYTSMGIYGLKVDSARDYKRTTLAIAQRIVDVAMMTRLPACDPSIFDQRANAFASRETT